jgi:hypothetical protein
MIALSWPDSALASFLLLENNGRNVCSGRDKHIARALIGALSSSHSLGRDWQTAAGFSPVKSFELRGRSLHCTIRKTLLCSGPLGFSTSSLGRTDLLRRSSKFCRKATGCLPPLNVNPSRIFGVGTAECQRHRVFPIREANDVVVIAHQAIAENP